jgi:hypothetical protein
MVRVSATAADLISEEHDAQRELEERKAPVARAQGSPGFGASADKIAPTVSNVLNAVSFPRFVTDLINGVFKAMIDSSSQQMQLFVQLLNSVSSSLDGFANTQYSLDQTMRWLVDHFPDSLQVEEPDVDPDATPEDLADAPPPRLMLKPGAQMPSEDAIRTTLGLQPDEPVDASDPTSLVPFARRQIARQRQQMLATMVMLGMQRIVVDSGRITAAMRFHIDTRSAASEESGNKFSLQNRVKASGSFGVGPWGASAEVENTIGYVSTQKSQSTEEMNTDLDLSSSVEINFKSDYLPLNRMASGAATDRIRANSLNPEAEAALASKERSQREAGQRQMDQQRMQSIDADLSPPAASGGATPATAAKSPSAGGAPAPRTQSPAKATPPAGGGRSSVGTPTTAPKPSSSQPGAATPAPAAA